MFAILKKETKQFFGSYTAYIAIGIFLLLCGLFLFVIPSSQLLDYNIIDNGYANLSNFFKLAPWVLLLLIPALTMRLFSDEFKTGTYEILKTKPLTNWQIIMGKYWAALFVVTIAILPTVTYLFAIKNLSVSNSIDVGSLIGSYIGLVLLIAVMVSVGLCASSYTNNAVIAFLVSVIICLLLLYLFEAVSKISFFQSGWDYYIEALGLNFHYHSISRGVIDSRDVLYFITLIFFFLYLTHRRLTTK